MRVQKKFGLQPYVKGCANCQGKICPIRTKEQRLN